MTPIQRIRHAGRELFLHFGVDIHPRIETFRFLIGMKIATVLDIGANEGQSARRFRKLMPAAKIYSFEPLPDVFRKMDSIKQRDSNFEAFNIGLSDETCETEFEVNDFSPSSSLLAIAAKATDAFPEIAHTAKIRVTLTTLDRWAENRNLQMPLLAKLDVQGLEDRVIRGGQKTLTDAAVIITEVSFARLYKGQPLFEDIHAQMCSLGFRCGGMVEPLYDPRTGEILQADAIFLPVESSPG